MEGRSSNFSGPPGQGPAPSGSFSSQMRELDVAANNLRLNPSQASRSVVSSNNIQGSASTRGNLTMMGLGFQANTSSQGSQNGFGPLTSNNQLVRNHANQRMPGGQLQARPNPGQFNRGNMQNGGQGQIQGATGMSVAQKQEFITQMSTKFQKKVAEIQKMISDAPENAISKELRGHCYNALRKLSQDFNETQRHAQREWTEMVKEHEITKMNLASAERDYAANQKYLEAANRENTELRALKLKQKASLERLNNLEKKWEKVNGELMEKLRIQEEQLAGKRALWLQANPSSSARRDAMNAIRDPYVTPTQSGFPSNSLVSLGSPLLTSERGSLDAPSKMKIPTGPAADNPNNMLRRKPNLSMLPTGIPQRSLGSFMSNTNFGTDKSNRQITEPGSKPPPLTGQALLDFYERQAREYRVAVKKILTSIESWTFKFADIPNPHNDRIIASSDEELWDFMLKCINKDDKKVQDAPSQVRTLLSSRPTRGWFVMRMVTTYITEEILNVKNFTGFGFKVDRIIQHVQAKIQERGLVMDGRQIYIEQQHEAIDKVLASPHFEAFRTTQLNKHTRALRDMVGPFLNDKTFRSQAGVELGAVVIKAWELSIKMNTSRLSFQIHYPNLTSKFSKVTMFARDYAPDDDTQMQLQAKQFALKLVITPAFTLRDDGGTSLRVRTFVTADVLLME